MSDVAARLAELVAINSVNASLPRGPGEQAMADYVAQAARAFGAEVELHEVEPGRPNILARIDRGRPRTLMFECHLDTVGLAPMPDALNPRIEGGRLYGRGSADPKGSLAAMLGVLEHAASDPAFPVNLWLAGSMDEEITMRGSRALAERRPAVDGVIVGEPTGLQPIVAHKGVLRWRVRTAGVAAHSATPERGRNAIFDMQTVIAALRAGVEPGLAQSAHPRLGSATWSVGTIQGGEAVNVVPDACQIDCDRRLLPGEEPDAILANVDRALDRIREADAGIRVEREPPYVHVPPMETASDEPGSAGDGARACASRPRPDPGRRGVCHRCLHAGVYRRPARRRAGTGGHCAGAHEQRVDRAGRARGGRGRLSRDLRGLCRCGLSNRGRHLQYGPL